MIGKLITLILVFVIGWVVYTQIFGTDEEQAMGEEVIVNFKQTVGSIADIFKHEGGKIKEGTYDDSIDKLGALLDQLREKSNDISDQQELKQLAEETEQIKQKVQQAKDGLEEVSDEETRQELQRITEKVQRVVENMEEEENKKQKKMSGQ